MSELNMNDEVKVRLTPAGREILRISHNRLNMASNGFLGDYQPPEEDSDGWSKWQLWCLMSSFGEHVYNGCDAPFETTIQICDTSAQPTIKPAEEP